MMQPSAFDTGVSAVEDAQKTTLVVTHDTIDTFALQLDIETMQSDLENMRFSSSILWSAGDKMTLTVGTQHDLHDMNELTIAIGTAFAF
ncbi:hypothetical protein [Pseudaestuariivita rosea]|uniref:hypothetical protein n=1 Tax=Pseudaestuariivita rosea TaxID=2763263 RepID=UPI001ABB3C06|nr:hypothetical protein [Pseudaestuariivita rosea]